MTSLTSIANLSTISGTDSTSITEKKPGLGPNVKWSLVEDSTLVDVLEEEKENGGQSESGWKKSVWVAVAERLKNNHPMTPPKMPDKCTTRFSRVSLNLLFCLI